MAGNAFQMVVLTKNINELQLEKSRNEQKLREVKNKRKTLEKKFESASIKHNQLEEKTSKLTETLKVAQHKVVQSHSELVSQLGANNQIQDQVKQIDDALMQQREHHIKDIEDFEEKLSQMADKFHRSRNFYKDESLLNEIELMKQKAHELDKDVIAVKTESAKKKQELSELQESLERMIRSQKKHGLTADVQKEVMSLLAGESATMEEFRLVLLERKNAVENQLENLRQWKPPQEIIQEE